jgi:hypothetical protein
MPPNDPKLSHGHGRLALVCNLVSQISWLNPKLKRQWPLGQLLSITHRTMLVNFSHFKQRFSPRKLIPVQSVFVRLSFVLSISAKGKPVLPFASADSPATGLANKNETMTCAQRSIIESIR